MPIPSNTSTIERILTLSYTRVGTTIPLFSNIYYIVYLINLLRSWIIDGVHVAGGWLEYNFTLFNYSIKVLEDIG